MIVAMYYVFKSVYVRKEIGGAYVQDSPQWNAKESTVMRYQVTLSIYFSKENPAFM